MSSLIWRSLMEATLRLTIVSGKPIYNQNRFPSHDHANRSPSLKLSTFTEPLGISQIYRIEGLGLPVLVTPFIKNHNHSFLAITKKPFV